MEEQIDKKVWTEKPFKIENTHLREQGIVDSKFRLIGINGKKLRIKRNNQTGKIKMVRKKNWKQKYQDFFYNLHDPWIKLYSFEEPSSTDLCNEERVKNCELKNKVCNPRTGRCNKTKKKLKKIKSKTKQSKTKSKTKQSKTKQSKTKQSKTKQSKTKQSKTKQVFDKVPSLEQTLGKDIVQTSRDEDIIQTSRDEDIIQTPRDEDIVQTPRDEDIIHSIKEVISPSDTTKLEEEEELKELMQKNDSPDIMSKSISISKQELKENFSHQCQELIDSIKGNLKNLSIQSKKYQSLLQCTENKNREQLEEYKKIDKLLYPHLDDPNIALKIANKKEFRDVEIPEKTREQIDNIEEESNKICSPNMQFELEPHQKFVRNFLSFQSPYNSLLIYHGLGTGKTCSSISVCEEMRNYYQQIGSNKKIMIVASPVVQENYKLQLFDERKLKLINGLWNLKACTGNKFIKEVNPMNTKGLSRERVVKQIKKIIRQSYEFLGYTEFANKIDKIMKKISNNNDKKIVSKQRRAIEREFSDRLLVIDEVHNIRANDVKRRTTKNLQDLVSFSKNMKLLLLTATPMFNEATEIVWLVNLMNLNDNRFPIKVSDIFTKENTFIEDERQSGKDILIQKLNGYVSYVSGENPFKFPFRIFPFEFNNPNSLKILKTTSEWRYPSQQINGLEITEDNQINYLDVYINTLQDFQERAYNYLIDKMKKKYPQLQEKRNGIQYTMMDGPLQILNFAYPHSDLSRGGVDDDILEKDIEKQLYGKRGLRRVMDYTKSTKREFKYKSTTLKNFGRIFSSEGDEPPLRKYSVKIHEFIKTIKKSEGICLIYSNFIDGGCVPIALALEEMGIYRLNQDKSLFKDRPTPPYKVKGHSAKYIMITGDKKLSPNNKLELKAATDSQNINGEKVKVIIISKAGSEGLDFQNIRQVHILEPWYNLNRADQIIGRGVRNKSHCLLPFNKRTVEIYLHASELRDNPMETIDMYMYRIAENKSLKIGQVTRLLKQYAVDCLLNKNQQNMNANNIQKNITLMLSNNQKIDYHIGHKDNSLICDFMECEYKCKPNDMYSDEATKETYNENYIVMNIEKILNKIKLLFREHYIYEKSDLKKRITMMKHYSTEQINMALDILINDDNEFLTDMLGRSGRLINVDKFYMFQPLEIDSSRPITTYQRRHPISFKHKQIVFKKKNIENKQPLSLEIKVNNDMELLTFKNSYLTLVNSSDESNKKDWIISARNAIENLIKYNNLPEEILVELALEHVFDSYSAKDKLSLLNEIELLKLNRDHESVMKEFSSEFFTMFQKIIDKISITYEDTTVIGVTDYSKKLIKHPLGIGFFKLDTKVSPNRWTVDVSGLDKKFVDTLLTRFKVDNSRINNFIGFLTNSKKKIVFKIKYISSSENKRTQFGQKLPTSGENKRVTIHRMNNILKNIKPEKKYGMTEEKTKIETIYGDSDIRNINDMELAAELELILKYLDLNQHNDKKWFFNTLEDKINNVEKIKI